MLRRGLKSLDELDEVKAYKKEEKEHLAAEEAERRAFEPTPLDNDLVVALEAYNPSSPF